MNSEVLSTIQYTESATEAKKQMTGFNLGLGGGGEEYREGEFLVGPWKLGGDFFKKKSQGRMSKKFRKRKCNVEQNKGTEKGTCFT